MNYAQTLEYLYARLPMFQRVGPPAFKKDLSNTRALLEALGHPERKFRAVHIAGTNGKGSVSHMLAALYTARGFRVGLYTSPHFRDFRERVRIGRALIPEEAVVEFVECLRPHIERIRPSFFEITVALAFDHFAREAVDLAVVETGLGGRLDSTNVLRPLLSVITNIGFDHQQFLGDTLPQIAAEKAGIIKPGVPVVVGQTHPQTAPVFRARARELGAPLSFADRALRLQTLDPPHPLFGGGSYRVLRGGKVWLEKVHLDLAGPFQGKNLRTALEAARRLDERHPEYQPRAGGSAWEGLGRVRELTGLVGRWQVLGERPLVLCDSAHNAEGLRLTLEALRRLPHRRLHIVLGMVADKDPDRVLRLFPRAAAYYFARPDIPRGKDAEALRRAAEPHGLQGRAFPSVSAALEAARAAAADEDLIFVGGSCFTVAEVL